jgi:hypothetical protein
VACGEQGLDGPIDNCDHPEPTDEPRDPVPDPCEEPTPDPEPEPEITVLLVPSADGGVLDLTAEVAECEPPSDDDTPSFTG